MAGMRLPRNPVNKRLPTGLNHVASPRLGRRDPGTPQGVPNAPDQAKGETPVRPPAPTILGPFGCLSLRELNSGTLFPVEQPSPPEKNSRRGS